MSKLRKILTHLKNENLYLYYLWTLGIRFRSFVELNLYSDRQSINRRYRKLSGIEPDIDNPVLFSEKMQWIKLNYHDPLMEVCADKYLVRDWVKCKGYSSILNDVYAVYDHESELNLNDLPDKFVIKATHGSGWNLVVKDKNSVNWFVWRKIFKSWLKGEIYWAGREWVYKSLKPRLICEKFLVDSSNDLMDFKFHCFNGEVHFIQVNQGRGTQDPIQNFYDLDWSVVPFGKDIDFKSDVNIPPPFQLEQMTEIAKDLSSHFPYARIDFYEVDKKIIFGEITFFPAGGYPDFKPSDYDKIWGDNLELPLDKSFNSEKN